MSKRTFDALWREYKPRRVRGKKTENEIIRIYEKYISPAFGGVAVDKVTYEKLYQFHQGMAGTPFQGNRVLSLLRSMFRFSGNALRWTDASYNPAKEVVMFAERKRRRHLRPSEAPRLARALYEREGTSPYGVLFIWLLLFTGARPSELKATRWCDIHGDKIILKEHKSVNKTGVDREISLPPIALEKIESLTKEEDRTDAFGEPSDNKIIPLVDPRRIWPFVRDRAKCHGLRMYDLRHTFGSYALEKGFTLDQIGEALAHTNPKTTKIYAELTDRSRKKISVDVSLAILEDMKVQ